MRDVFDELRAETEELRFAPEHPRKRGNGKCAEHRESRDRQATGAIDPLGFDSERLDFGRRKDDVSELHAELRRLNRTNDKLTRVRRGLATRVPVVSREAEVFGEWDRGREPEFLARVTSR